MHLIGQAGKDDQQTLFAAMLQRFRTRKLGHTPADRGCGP